MRTASLGALAAVLCAACGSNQPPKIQPIADQLASVGIELSIQVRATDADGDPITFDFACPALPDLKTRAMPATITTFADGVAIFRWTPQASDRSPTPYAFDFRASDGKATTTETVRITVNDAGATSGPVFREPLGTGTTLDLDKTSCIDVPILVDDTGATQVTIAEGAPQIDGAMLMVSGPFAATWHWCPSDAQVAAKDRYLLLLSADDGASPKALKSYLVVLRKTPPDAGCPGTPPVITHTPPGPQTTIDDIGLAAVVTDDVGIAGTPIVYYTTTAPPTPPDVTMMSQVPMTLTDAATSTWSTTLPNPVAAMPDGTTVTLYYLIEARDTDDPTGVCNHLTDSPSMGTYSVAVTKPIGTTRGTLGSCDPCTHDMQCAGMIGSEPAYDCIVVGTLGQTFCARECTGSPACPTGYLCTPSASSGVLITSVDGVMSRFCKPSVGYCGPMP
jgi:hypothetical protein